MIIPVPTKLFLLTTFFIVQFLTTISAQKSKKEYSWEVGISGGASKFLNSINPNSDAENRKYNYWDSNLNSSFSISVIKNISNQFSAELEWLTTKLSGSWNESSGYSVPQLATNMGLPYPEPFKTGINDFELMVSVNLNKVIWPKLKVNKWNVFIKGGGGLCLLKSYQSLFPFISSNNPFKYSYAYGAGLTYKIDGKLKIKIGITFRQIDTDRLDGIHSMKSIAPFDAYFNVKEVYSNVSIGVVYGLFAFKNGNSRGNSNRFPWFGPSSKKYKGRK